MPDRCGQRFFRGIILRSESRKFQGLRSAAGFTPYLCVYAGIAFGFYWLMQPTVVPNQGLAAYKPPPLAVVNYSNQAFVPPVVSEPPPPPILAATPPRDAVQTVAAAPEATVAPAPEKKVVKRREARATPRRERPERTARVRPAPSWNYAFGAPNGGFRPWF
jgi:hypothetical protein